MYASLTRNMVRNEHIVCILGFREQIITRVVCVGGRANTEKEARIQVVSKIGSNGDVCL